MTQAQGSNAQIIIQQESTFNADPGTPDALKLNIVSEGLQKSQSQETSEILRGNRNPVKAMLGNVDVAGPIQTRLQAFGFGMLIKGALGSVVTSGTGPYVHTIKVGNSLPSYLVEKGFTDINQFFKYNGCKVSRMSIQAKAEGFQDMSFDLIGVGETTSGASFDNTATDDGFQPFGGFHIASILEGGSAIANVTEASIEIDNGLDGSVYAIGGVGVRSAIPEGVVKVSGTIKAMFENLTLYNKAVNETESSLKLVWQLGSGDGSAGNESLEILIPELTYAPQAPAINGPTGVFVDLPFEAFYDNSTEATSIQIILKNTEVDL